MHRHRDQIRRTLNRPGNMNTQHTPGPWKVSTANPYAVNTVSGGIATAHGTDDANYSEFFPSTEQAKANARRIVACVNACEGINPEAVPDLLEALKDAVAAYDDADLDGAIIRRLRAAIAKAQIL